VSRTRRNRQSRFPQRFWHIGTLISNFQKRKEAKGSSSLETIVRIRSRILSAFIVVIAVAVSVMAFTSHLYINSIFDRYAKGYRSALAEQWEFLFGTYYLHQGSWEGLENNLFPPSRLKIVATPVGYELGRIRSILQGESLLLTDEKGQVILDSQHEKMGEKLPGSLLARGTPLVIEGERVGTLILQPHTSRAVLTLEAQFSHSVFFRSFSPPSMTRFSGWAAW